MHTHKKHHDECRNPEWEHRLCWDEAPKEGFFERFGKSAKAFVEEWAEKLPIVGEKLREEKDEQRLRHLTDHTNWVQVFLEHPEALEGGGPIVQTGRETEGMKAVIDFMEKKLSPEDRRAAFLQYVDEFIPQEVQEQEQYRHIFAREKKDTPDDRFRSMGQGNLLTAKRALAGILGVDLPETPNSGGELKPGSSEHLIALESLRRYYRLPPGVDLRTTPIAAALRSDFRSSIPPEFQNFDPATTSVRTILEKTQTSRFRGALKLGVVDRPVLERLTKDQDVRSEKEQLAQMATTTQLERLRESMDVIQRYDNLEPGYKLLMWGVLALMALSERGRPILAALGVAALTSKLTTGKGPLEWLNELTKNLPPGVSGMGTEGKDWETIRKTGEAIRALLPEQDQHNIEFEAEGFAILSRAPLNVLAKAMPAVSGPDAEWEVRLDTPEGRKLHKALRAAYKSQDIEKFLEKKNVTLPSGETQEVLTLSPVMSEALSFYFYLLEKEANPNDKDVKFVEEARSGLPDEYGYPALTGDARARYAKVVNRGIERAKGIEKPLGNFTVEILRAKEEALRDRKEEPRSSLAEQLFPEEADKPLRNKLQELETQGYRFQPFEAMGGKWLRVEGPPSDPRGITVLNDLSRPFSIVAKERFSDILKSPDLGGALRGEVGRIMREDFMTKKLEKIHYDLNPPGPPVLVEPGLPASWYDGASMLVRVKIRGGREIQIPAHAWLDRLLKDGMEPGDIVAKEGVVVLTPLALPAGPGSPLDPLVRPDIDPASLGDLGAWTVEGLRVVLAHPARFRSGIFRAVYSEKVKKGSSMRARMEALRNLEQGAGSLVDIRSESVTLERAKLGGKEGFVPVYSFEMVKQDGSLEPISGFLDVEGFIDKSSI